jgi:hypothetical protein
MIHLPTRHLQAYKGKVGPIHNLSTASGRNRGAWGCSSTCTYPLPCVEVNGQFHTLVALSLGQQPPVPTEQEVVWVPWPAL